VSLGFLIDAQLPRAMRDWLAALGHVAIHVSAILPPDASDELIWSVAGNAISSSSPRTRISSSACWRRLSGLRLSG
jgi:hypothetical protein